MAAEFKGAIAALGKSIPHPHLPSIHLKTSQIDIQFAEIASDLNKKALVIEHENSECPSCKPLSIKINFAIEHTKGYPRYLRNDVHEAAIEIYRCATKQTT